MSKKTYGETLRKMRRSADVTQHQLAAHLGTSGAYISAIESGRRAPLSVVRSREIEELLGTNKTLISLAGGKLMSCGCVCRCK